MQHVFSPRRLAQRQHGPKRKGRRLPQHQQKSVLIHGQFQVIAKLCIVQNKGVEGSMGDFV